jgi:hypothetical protein
MRCYGAQSMPVSMVADVLLVEDTTGAEVF